MPREQASWFTKQSVHDSDKVQARQSCSYYSIINVNKKNYPYLSSYEKEQTWTLTRTVSNNHKRYQSSIENIHLTMPMSTLKIKRNDYENVNVRRDRSISRLTSEKHASSLRHSYSASMSTIAKQEQMNSPIKIMNGSRSNSNMRSILSLSKPMRPVGCSSDFTVRI